jgi:hypothetical protein
MSISQFKVQQFWSSNGAVSTAKTEEAAKIEEAANVEYDEEELKSVLSDVSDLFVSSVSDFLVILAASFFLMLSSNHLNVSFVSDIFSFIVFSIFESGFQLDDLQLIMMYRHSRSE